MTQESIKNYQDDSISGRVINDDCLITLDSIPEDSIDLVYVDPPFFTQGKQKILNKNNEITAYDDIWDNKDHYMIWVKNLLIKLHKVLKETGSVYFHCDWRTSHWIRQLLDEVFFYKNFRNEIIWTYKRWSTSSNSLQKSHQSIYFYSKTNNHKINIIYENYSSMTNLDQNWQGRGRDCHGRSIYKKKENGETESYGKQKKGVPLRDVWDIPYLNPKAKERVGYPNQKPFELLERIIRISSAEGDTVLDPCCGSGTTLVAAKLLGRKYIGIDISESAINITKQRLKNPVVSRSCVTLNGRKSYSKWIYGNNKRKKEIFSKINAKPVYRNKHLDGFLNHSFNDEVVGIKILDNIENITESTEGFKKAIRKRNCKYGVIIKNGSSIQQNLFSDELPNCDNIVYINYGEIGLIEEKLGVLFKKF
ncbi:site-specific DNA-methyltransferase [Desulfococcaceae bacterium HSG8]|nr:site-specific DNA-methyltransferase [Desulfococcaceae bacterium HSG8]